MLSSRALLVRQLQDFFESQMMGRFTWGRNVELRVAEKMEKVIGYRQLDKEVAVADFGGYSLMISSPDHEPPLGKIMLFSPERGILVDGPIDTTTWDSVAKAIKEKEHDHVA